jgi:dTDP-4-amino-4,6-dideoxygalactose transaminase
MISLIDIRRQTAAIRNEIEAAIGRVLDHGQFILGPEVRELEERIAAYCRTRFAVACASGSDALLLALMALNVGPGDKVITPPFTFFATAGSIARLGATPVFVDIDAATFNMNPKALQAAVDDRVKTIMPVHLFGQCAEMDEILAIAERHAIPVIEDAAQAIGAEYHGKRAGSMGRCGCFSFFPTKNMGACGDAGILTTNDPALAERLRMLRVHGSKVRYVHERVGVNSRLDTMQAAILLVKLQYLDQWTEKRRAHATFYRERLATANVTLPADATDRHIYNQFTIRVQDRGEVKTRMAAAGVSSEIYYPIALHLQECFEDLGYKPGDFPESEQAAREVLSLPVEEGLTPGDLAAVAQAVMAAAGERDSARGRAAMPDCDGNC